MMMIVLFSFRYLTRHCVLFYVCSTLLIPYVNCHASTMVGQLRIATTRLLKDVYKLQDRFNYK